MVKQWKKSLEQSDILSDSTPFDGGNIDGKISNAGAPLRWGREYTISTVQFGRIFDVSGEDDSPTGMVWGDDGSQLYVVGDGTNSIYQYNTPTSYDISSATFSQSLDVSDRENILQDIVWNDDGMKFYIVGDQERSVIEYTLSTAYDISTASFAQDIYIGGEENTPNGLAWNNDGTQLYVIGSDNQVIAEYSLSTAYDIGTASFTQSFDVSGQDIAMQGLAWNDDGTQIHTVGESNADIYIYTLSTAYDISTASFAQTVDVSEQDTSPTGLAWNDDGTRLYLVEGTGAIINSGVVGQVVNK